MHSPKREFMNKMVIRQLLKVYFQRVRIMDKEKAGELVDAFIFEAIRDTDYDYYYDY
jgi:hypothetical protein